MKYKALPGVFDVVARGAKDEWRLVHYWQFVERVIRETAHDFGFEEIRTPIFERTELFQRSVGEETDIVSKEMYSFEDRGGRMVSLRPEGTAPVMRAFVENSLQNLGSTHKIFYLGPMFRYERSQAGRYRQHHQFGAEAIGSGSPEQDVEIIALIYTVYSRLGIRGLEITLNSLGNPASRPKYRTALKDYLSQHKSSLSEDSRRRYEHNPLRILDSKAPEDREVVAQAPVVLDFLEEEEARHFETVQKLLTAIEIPFTVNPHLVRGLDYYTRTVFEVVAEEIGAQNSVGGGGRYDGLLKSLGGPDLPAMGFGMGIERIIQTMLAQKIALPIKPSATLFLIPLGETAREICFSLCHQLRLAGISTHMDLSGRKLNKVMQYTDQIGVRYVAVIGEEELSCGKVTLKEMATGSKTEVPLSSLSKILQIEDRGENLLSIWNAMPSQFEESEEADFFFSKLHQTISETKELTKKMHSAMQSIKEWL